MYKRMMQHIVYFRLSNWVTLMHTAHLIQAQQVGHSDAMYETSIPPSSRRKKMRSLHATNFVTHRYVHGFKHCWQFLDGLKS